MSRSIRFSRILEWFREADADEVRAIMPLVLETLGKRKIATGAAPVQRRRRRLNGPVVAIETDLEAQAGQFNREQTREVG